MSMSRRVRALDVAEAAGVSTATVSYVLNDTPGQKISKETAERVRDTAKQLGYISNPAAQALARGKSNFVILDMSDFVTQESATIASTPILRMLRNIGYEPFMTWWPGELEGFTRADRLVRFARATHPGAIISILPLEKDLRDQLQKLGVASISSAVATPEDLVPALALSVKAQVAYLAEKGHTHVFYAASSQPSLDHLVELRNLTGRRTAAEHSVTWTALPRYDSMPHLASMLQEAMQTSPEATAIACYNDADALTVLFALHSLQVRIPERMAVIGIDNDSFGALTYPSLTTVTFDFVTDEIDAASFTKAIEGNGAIGMMPNLEEVTRPRILPRDSA